MSQPEKAIPQNQADAMPGGVTRAVAVEDTTNDVVRYGDAANKAVRVNVVAGGGGGGGTVTQGPAGNPNDPWNMEVTEDGTDLPVKPGDAANKAVRVNIVAGSGGTATQGPAGNPNDPWNTEVTEDGTDLPVKAGDATLKAVRSNVVASVATENGTDLPVKVGDDANKAIRANIVATGGAPVPVSGDIDNILVSVTPGTGPTHLGKAIGGGAAATGDVGAAALAVVDDNAGTIVIDDNKYAPLYMDKYTRSIKAIAPYLSESLTPFVANNDTLVTAGTVGPQTKLSACLKANGSVVAAVMTIVVLDSFGNPSATILTLTAADLNALKGVSVVIPFIFVQATLTGLTFGTATTLTLYITTAP